ncbi:MAG: twin-arginine translocation signal domain-containing protein, partial [Candidatus Latescibacteria bacterium]|nr:twin-arginine translocation signal domain-containing protein [Candidatus Latescibacterota bacterium]
MKTKSLITGIPLSSGHLNRRNFIKGTGLAAASGIAGCGESTVPVSSVQKLRIPVPTYESIGAKTFINCSDAYTILSGSLMPAEVKQSMMRAAEHYVHMDNLAECVGSRLAELTGAEWGCI